MLVERGPSDDLGLESVVDFGDELERQGLTAKDTWVRPESRTDHAVTRDEGGTLRIVVGGMQWVSRSYSRARTCNSRAGERSAKISSAVREMSASQSGGGTGVLSVTRSLHAGVSEQASKPTSLPDSTHF